MNSRARIELPGHGGIRLAGDLAGPDEGFPVLLLHGGGQTRNSWGRALDALAAQGARAVAIDMRGHGDSDWSPDAAYLPADFGGDVENAARAFSAQCGGRPVLLVGASMGGMAGLVATPRLGGLVAGLVLVDIVPEVRMDGARRILDFMSAAPDGFGSLEEAADSVAAYLPHRPRPALTEGLRRNLRRQPNGRWTWHWDPRLVREVLNDVELVRGGLDEAAASIAVPTLLIRGLLSDIVDDDGVAHLRGLVPQLEVLDIADAAHTAATDDNDAFVASVLAFADRIAAAAR
ncbi:MAG TPA: alpha/beta fold hydrolase [Sporichthya sp.]|nr:alpha/beta fold hydrolase [Sporichthya sp.]